MTDTENLSSVKRAQMVKEAMAHIQRDRGGRAEKSFTAEVESDENPNAALTEFATDGGMSEKTEVQNGESDA